MSSVRTRLGAVISLCWIAGIAYLAIRDPAALAKMSPNEWGDFLAGSFAPLAFLWLVLGYLQQGDELRLSTDALRLQAEELKNSVQQQRELVEVSRQQVESEREALAFERRLREDLSEPKFSVLGGGGAFRGDGQSSYNITISNTGHDATAFSARINILESGWREIMSYPLFGKGASYTTRLEHPKPLEEGYSLLSLAFTDGLGRTVEKTYQISRESEHPHAGLIFQRTDA
ncbi:MAG: hypothetical protein RL489_90 [Pseudomonadota bacterium]|jgi:hypothetical protein